MRTKDIITIEIQKEVTIYKCDFCDYAKIENKGCCGVSPIMKCSLCSKDCCKKHRYLYFDGDFVDVVACEDCYVLFDKAWNIVSIDDNLCEELPYSAIEKFKELKKK